MSKPRYLMAGTTSCPKCKGGLEWEQHFGFMKVYNVDGKELYQGRCMQCKTYWGVKTK
ncbi:TPA: hypothetical protein ACJIK4_003523 [Kluyvera cryocrescens]